MTDALREKFGGDIEVTNVFDTRYLFATNENGSGVIVASVSFEPTPPHSVVATVKAENGLAALAARNVERSLSNYEGLSFTFTA